MTVTDMKTNAETKARNIVDTFLADPEVKPEVTNHLLCQKGWPEEEEKHRCTFLFCI
jgi:hypothetical protein